MFDEKKEEKLEKTVRWTITLPLSMSIKIDIMRKATNDTKSSWIRKAINKSFLGEKTEFKSKNKTEDSLSDLIKEVRDLKRIVNKNV